MTWLLRQDIASRIEQARIAHKVSADERANYEARVGNTSAARSDRVSRVAGSVMEISVAGVLTKYPDIFAWLFYGENTAYTDVIEALAVAESDPAIKSVTLNVDSPGGSVHGLFDLLGVLQSFSKKVEVVSPGAASAAYAIAAVAPGKIRATNAAAEFGSVGVVASYQIPSDVQLIDITSTNAPNKRPDVTTEEGQAVIRAELDALHELFVGAIAEGRGMTSDEVNERFGQGGMLIASEAKKRGMIDSIAQPAARVERKQSANAENKGKIQMDESELKAQHPELYAAVLAKGKEAGHKEGHEAGVADERKRVGAHLKLGKTTGALDVAFAAIESGVSTLDEAVHADYQAAAFKSAQVSARTEESAAAEAAGADAAPETTETAGPDLQEQALAIFNSKGAVRA